MADAADPRADGMTDEIVLPLIFANGDVHSPAWATMQPGGFTDAERSALAMLASPLARVIEIMALRRTAAILLDTYVGNRAGARILAGRIRRGHTEVMNAAIWLSDMRNFTALSDSLPAETIVDVLNRYFDRQVPAIRAHGGEVLKFMGDGLLSIFPIDTSEPDAAAACARALDAARECSAAVHALTYRHDGGTIADFRLGVALHVGQVLYGNIGGSSEFVRHVDLDWVALGSFPVRGFAVPEEVFGLPDD